MVGLGNGTREGSVALLSLAPVPPVVPAPPWHVFGQLPFLVAFALGPWAGARLA